MEMKNILSLGERLKVLIDKAEAEAEELISQAQNKSDETLTMVKEDAERRRQRAGRRTGLEEFLTEAEILLTRRSKRQSIWC